MSTQAQERLRRRLRVTAVAPRLLGALKALLAAYDAVPEDEPIPDALNDPEQWAEVRDLIAAIEGDLPTPDPTDASEDPE